MRMLSIVLICVMGRAECTETPLQKQFDLSGHRFRINSIAFSPDGKLVVSAGGYDDSGLGAGDLILWDAATGKKVSHRRLGVDDSRLFARFISNDEVLIALGSKAYAWTFRDGKERFIFWNGHERMLFFPIGDLIVTKKTVNERSHVNVYDLRAGTKTELPGEFGEWLREKRPKLANVLEPDLEALECLAMASKNSLMFVKSRNGQSKIWDVEGEKLVSEFGDKDDRIGGAAFSPDGSLLAIGVSSNIRLLDIKNHKLIADFDPQLDRVTALTFSPDGKILVSGHLQRALVFWDVSKFQKVR